MASPRWNGGREPAARTALLDATEGLMLEEGYAAATSRRVAERAGMNAALVYYYFGTMDDLFIALFRRGAERSFQRQAAALSSSQPLWGLWDTTRDQSSTELTMEFIALANHRKAIRAEIAAYSMKFRHMQLESLTGVLARYGVDPKVWPATSLILMVTALSRHLLIEKEFDVEIGHVETIALIEQRIRELEGERKKPMIRGATRRKHHRPTARKNQRRPQRGGTRKSRAAR